VRLGYAEVRKGSAEVVAAIAAARSARNLLSRRERAAREEEIEARRARTRRRKKEREELEQAVRGHISVSLKENERPRIGPTTARKLFQRTKPFGYGSIGKSDFRGPDGRHSIHFQFTARGFASWKGRRWRNGEAERAARYIVREGGLEGGEHGWWSNIAKDRTELVGFFRVLEAIERNDRKNANVYVSEIIALPAELSARQRRFAVRRVCQFFETRDLPYVAALHTPDGAGDQRNFHCHILYSLRPACRLGEHDWEFAVAKVADINTPAGIKERRRQVVRDINRTLIAARIDKRLTHLSNRVRGMIAPEPTQSQAERAIARRLDGLEKRKELLEKIKTFVSIASTALVNTSARLQSAKKRLAARLEHRRLAMARPLARQLAPINTLESLRPSTAAALRGKRDIVDVASVVGTMGVETRGSVVGMRMRAYAKRVVRRRMWAEEAISFATFETLDLLSDRKHSLDIATTTSGAAVESSKANVTRSLEHLRLATMQRVERAQARLEIIKNRARALRRLLVARRAFEIADEQRQDALVRLHGHREILASRLQQMVGKDLGPLAQRLDIVRTVLRHRCIQLRDDITARSIGARHRLRRLEPLGQTSGPAKQSSTGQGLATPEQPSVKNKSCSSVKPRSTSATGRFLLASQPASSAAQTKWHTQSRTAKKELQAPSLKEQANSNSIGGYAARNYLQEEGKVAAASSQQGDDAEFGRLLRRALDRLQTLQIPINRTEAGKYWFADNAIPAEEFAVFMHPSMEGGRQIVLGKIAERQQRRQRQALASNSASQSDQKVTDDQWDRTLAQYHNQKRGRESR